MKGKDILVGTIKECENAYFYEKYGESREVDDFEIGSTTYGHLEKYVNTVTDQAILIKYDEERYIWLNSLTSLSDAMLVSCGIPIKVLYTSPTSDGELYVDTSLGLTPYYEEEKNEKRIGVLKLKKDTLLDPRIKSGVEC